MAEIRKSLTRHGEESKKRPREQSSGEMMETLIKLLNNLKDELKSVPGTPAIHLYSILDQVAALHDLLNSDGRWLEVEILLVGTLRQCQDCTKRNRVRRQGGRIYVCEKFRLMNSSDLHSSFVPGYCSPSVRLRISQITLAPPPHRESRCEKLACPSTRELLGRDAGLAAVQTEFVFC